MGFTDTSEAAILNHYLNGIDLPSYSGGIWLALFSTATDDTGAGTELAGNGYARINVSGDFTIAGTVTRGSNNVLVQFSASGGDWVKATHCAFMSLISAGVMISQQELAVHRILADGEDMDFLVDMLGMTVGDP